MAIFDKIIDGALSEIGAVIVGVLAVAVTIVFGKHKIQNDKKFQQKQKAGSHSSQTMELPSDGEVEAVQEAGDDSVQVQKGDSRNV